ncbi:Peroxin 13, N-terminal region-domain-containing protein [Phycomyces nitens]|nr:Peroxin 13, N-terminal region-domain-containing protein [Phycomyces nitens]
MPSPPKPWEVNNSTVPVTAVVSPQTNITGGSTTNDSAAPSVPLRTSLGTTNGLGGLGNTTGYGTSSALGGGYGTYNRMGSGYGGGYGSGYSSGYGGGYGGGYSSGYGSYGSSYGGMNSYSSYNRLGSYGSNYSPYGQFGYGGGGMYGAGGPGGPGGPGDFSLTQRMESGTRATFDVIEQVVGAFGGFAQMLDSTYMATYSSFMAMVGVAEQFGHLRQYLGRLFSIYTLLRWLKRMFYKLTGRTPPPELEEPATQGEGEQLQITESEAEGDLVEKPVEQKPTHRRRAAIIFMAVVFGLPYMVFKLMQRASHQREMERQMLMQARGFGTQGPYFNQPQEVTHALHDFVAETPMELNLRRGDTVYILSKVDPATGAPSQWWQGQLEDGSVGIFPGNYVAIPSRIDHLPNGFGDGFSKGR